MPEQAFVSVKFAVVRTHDRGAALPHAALARVPVVVGDLNVSLCQAGDDMAVTASLCDGTQGLQPDLLPRLTDTRLLTIGGQGLLLQGFETLNTRRGRLRVCQRWWVRFLRS